MFPVGFSDETVATAIVDHVRSWNSCLLGAAGLTGVVPAWHPNGESYLTDELAPPAAMRLTAHWDKKRWMSFRRYLSQLGIHIRGKVVCKLGADTAAHTLNSLLSDFGWTANEGFDAFRKRCIEIIDDKHDTARQEKLAELINQSYTAPP